MTSTTPSPAVLPLSRYMPERLDGGIIRYLSYPSNVEGFYDEKTGKRFAKLLAIPTGAAADGYDFVDEELWKWEFHVTSYTIGEQFTQYTINCSAFNVDWLAAARYSEMLQLVQALYTTNMISLDEFNSFPAKGSFVWSAKESFVRERKVQLDSFFRTLFLANPILMRQPSVLDFVKAPPRVVTEVLVHAAAESDFSTVQLLLNAGTDVNAWSESNGWTALHHAARNGDENLVRQLLDRAADANVRVQPRAETSTYAGWTPLCFACANGHHVVVQTLIVNHADVNVETSDGNTPFSLAVKGHFAAATRILLSRPELEYTKAISSEIFNGSHLSALHIAAQNGDATIIKMLLDKDMDVNLNTDTNSSPGWTPLHWAAQSGHNDAVGLLLQSHANPTLKTSVKYKGTKTARDTPAEIAMMFGHEQLARRLADAEENWRTNRATQEVNPADSASPEQDQSMLKYLRKRSTSNSSSAEDKEKQQRREKRASRSDRLTAWLMGEDLAQAPSATVSSDSQDANTPKTEVSPEGEIVQSP